jgi:hypothetical protein
MDPELFDRGQFQAELALKSSPIAAFKKALKQAREVLDVLRSIRQSITGIRMVYTGSIGLHHVLDELRGGGEVSHAPMNDMDRLDVPPLERADAIDLAQRIIAGESLPADAPVEIGG